MADFFATRDSIKSQIEAEIPELRKIYVAEEIENLSQASQIVPAVHLLYAGYQPAQTERGRVRITVDQTWAVVLVIRQKPGEYAGGEILGRLIEVLHGFKPADAMMALELAGSPYSPRYTARTAFYPLAFTTRVIHDTTGA